MNARVRVGAHGEMEGGQAAQQRVTASRGGYVVTLLIKTLVGGGVAGVLEAVHILMCDGTRLHDCIPGLTSLEMVHSGLHRSECLRGACAAACTRLKRALELQSATRLGSTCPS